MRHRKRGRRLGRSSSHRHAMMRNLAASLILTEREDEYYDGLMQADGRTAVIAPKRKGRVVTTLEKAKEVRSLVERCVTIAKNAQKHMDAAAEFETDAERNSDEWREWRKSDNYRKWNDAIAPAVNARRRVFALLRDREAVSLLFDTIAERFLDRPGGYTRVIRLATPRLGDAGTQAVLEFVGTNDRVTSKSAKPQFGDDDAADETDAADESTDEAPEIDEMENDDAGAEASADSDADKKED